ncbi:transcription termination factor NusA, C-terminal duplication [Desulfuromusa kysingii]|uniref:Transcription termination factor NusA, C-terminal duplication n=1 Tax=Desulfuromusa kysingii TaxID=37625 RepID=A0A1H3ZSB8_9BACT|nr:helix-hairpin-helix domain-containing protein [Desulfuromusa kysingii]SEA26599.1 transcription termination factor NusA, C-terminal duplication [Desulfuromusa kysingii]
MSNSILEVRGIGPSTATALTENGITTIAELAAKDVGQLAAIKGFSEIRAAQVITAAKALLTETAEPVVAKPSSKKKEKPLEETSKKGDKKKSKKSQKAKPEPKKVKSKKKGKKSDKAVKKSKNKSKSKKKK